MKKVILGKTGLEISRLGFGGIPIQRIDAAGTRKLFEAMREKGINYVDTARGYTVSESYIGEAMEGMRQDFVVATKSMARTYEAMKADIETSLKNLRTDYIDLYQVHNPNMAQLEQVVGEDGALKALLEAKEAGKIGHIGLTAHLVPVAMAALEYDWVETLMFPYNIVETQGEEILELCKAKNVGFIDMKPLAGGAIEDARAAMRFVAKDPRVTVIIPGMAELSELDINIAAVEDESEYSEAEVAKEAEIRNMLGNQFSLHFTHRCLKGCLTDIIIIEQAGDRCTPVTDQRCLLLTR